MSSANRWIPCRLVLGWLILVLATAGQNAARGHEGHAPLPTKGVEVDARRGLVSLSPDAYKALRVRTVEAGVRPLAQRVLAYATLVAPWKQHAFATSRVAGRVARIHVRPGEQVETGQLLVDVESTELEALRLELLHARNAVGLSKLALRQAEQLGDKQVVSQRELTEARSKHQENLNAVEIAERKLASLGVPEPPDEPGAEPGEPARTLAISSPISGTVTHTDLSVGKVVAPSEHLVEILDTSTVWVQIGVLERDLHLVEPGQKIELTLSAFPGQVFETRVAVKGLYLDPHTHLATVWADLSNPADSGPRFLPGMHGQAQLNIAASQDLVTVPKQAVQTAGVERYVLVEESATGQGYEYRRRNIVPGQSAGGFVQIRQGDVFPGDRVVTAGSHELSSLFIQGVLRLSPQAAESIGLALEPVGQQVVQEVIEFDGTVQLPPGGLAAVSSQLKGTVKTILVERGQQVRAGDVLAEIASLELENLQLKLLESHLRIGLLEDTLGRLGKLDDVQVLARRRLWETESQYKAALDQRDSLRRQLEILGLSRRQLERLLGEQRLVEALPIRSPIDGVVVAFDRALGEAVGEREALLEIHDLSRVWVQGHVSERDLARIRIDEQSPQQARVRFSAYPGLVVEGIVRRSGQLLGSQDRTLAVWIELSGTPAELLHHNMLARVAMVVDQTSPVLAVPHEAVVREGTRAFVFVQKRDGTFQRRRVQPGRRDDRYQEIVAGLSGGEVIAVRAAAQLQTAYASLR